MSWEFFRNFPGREIDKHRLEDSFCLDWVEPYRILFVTVKNVKCRSQVCNYVEVLWYSIWHLSLNLCEKFRRPVTDIVTLQAVRVRLPDGRQADVISSTLQQLHMCHWNVRLVSHGKIPALSSGIVSTSHDPALTSDPFYSWLTSPFSADVRWGLWVVWIRASQRFCWRNQRLPGEWLLYCIVILLLLYRFVLWLLYCNSFRIVFQSEIDYLSFEVKEIPDF